MTGITPGPLLGRLTIVPPRDVWPREAHDFTPWLLENVDVLSDLLGMDLALEVAEHPVGGFSLDLLGRDDATGQVVIVENQLDVSDHTHLGQILTYAAGTDPTTIVWVATGFRPEHRAAIDWLNARTDESTRFFGVEIEVVRIGDSAPAPAFKLVAQPNDWEKQVKAEKASPRSGKAAAYGAFWTDLLDRIRANHPDWTRASVGPPQSWITLPYGTSNVWYGMVFALTGPRVELYFGANDAGVNEAAYNAVLAHRDVLDAEFGSRLLYDPLPGKKSCRIHYDRAEGGSVLEVDSHEGLMEWFIDVMERFRPATQKVRALVESKTV
jgi:Domain of unknown function (DUF4268)